MALERPEEFMARLRSGFSLSAVIKGRNTPDGKPVRGLGTRKGFFDHCLKNLEWGCEAMALVEKNGAAARKRKGRALTHCKRGHLLAGSNLAFKRDTKDGNIYRYCIACHNHRGLCGADMKPEQVRRVRAAVAAGFNISEITRGGRGLRSIVTFSTLRRYRVEHPEFDRFIIRNAVGLARAVLMQFRIVPSNAAFDFPAPSIARKVAVANKGASVQPYVMQEGDREWILSLIVSYVHRQDWDDVIQNIFVALYSQALSRESVPSFVKIFVRDHYGLFPDEANGEFKRPFSLNAGASFDDDRPLIERVSRGLWD